ncbi:MAG: hypothetical protein QXT26_08645 [Thermoproteota archaeon]
MLSDETVDYEYIDDDVINKRLEELKRRRQNVCLGRAFISGTLLSRGMIIRVKIKGRGKDEVIAVFDCYNPYYNWLRLVIEDEVILVKLSDIRYIAIPREAREQKKEAGSG